MKKKLFAFLMGLLVFGIVVFALKGYIIDTHVFTCPDYASHCIIKGDKHSLKNGESAEFVLISDITTTTTSITTSTTTITSTTITTELTTTTVISATTTTTSPVNLGCRVTNGCSECSSNFVCPSSCVAIGSGNYLGPGCVNCTTSVFCPSFCYPIVSSVPC